MSRFTEQQEDALAAEFVLGTLHGHARTRFIRLLMTDSRLRNKIWQWEKNLNQLSEALPEKSPDPKVWLRIREILQFNAEVTSLEEYKRDKTKRPKRPSWWLPISAALSTAAVLLVIVLYVPDLIRSPAAEPQFALVQNNNAQALWLIRLHDNELSVRATDNLRTVTDKDYELWLVAADGRPPVSLGLLPKQGGASLPRPKLFDEVEVAALAVSLEPLGGSPTGSPTEVLYTAQLVKL